MQLNFPDELISHQYSGQPEPTVDWLFNGFKINSFDSKFKHTAQFATMHNNQSVTIFQIKDIHEDHFGDYTCKVANNLGNIEKTVHLSGKPGPPALLVRDNQLSWTVQSVEPISEYKLHYRLAQEDTWKNHKIFKSDRSNQDEEMWTHSIPLNFLDPNTDYELQLSARNTLGWGSLARNYVSYKSSSDLKPESNKMTGAGDANVASVSSSADWLRTAIPLFLLVVVLL
uniref:Ig-like domain-containing protein n=1 Tax=Ditylenchus dipsaci TaxID=166011 RepID=A0A915EIL9_9BILA